MRWSPPLFLFIACVTPFAVMRAGAIVSVLFSAPGDASLAFVGSLGRGFASDLLVAWVLALLLSHFEKYWRVVLILFSVVAALNGVHIRVNASNADISFLRLGFHPIFLEGSIFNSHVFMMLTLVLGMSTLFVALGALILRRSSAISRGLQALTSPTFPAVLLIALALWHPSLMIPNWVGMNVIEENAIDLWNRKLMASTLREKELDEHLQQKYFRADLDGVPRIPLAGKKQNVLVIAVEGLNRPDLEKGHYPNLQKRVPNSLYYHRFYTQQKQTDRGIYALFCGDYPNILSKDGKTQILSSSGLKRRCLPRILEENGYQTYFLQGSPLGFMGKDRFAEMAGFGDIKGVKSFEKAYNQNGWGVDDRTLFERVLEKIRSFQKTNKPWMMGVLTTGTHHPFNVPADHVPHAGPPTLRDAEEYMDKYLEVLLEALKKEGVLENTLVLITGDEASPEAVGPTIHEQFNFHRSFLVALTPSGDRGRIEDVYSQMDLSLSVADYLGLSHEGLMGRSVFRDYRAPMDRFYSDVFTEKVYRLNFSAQSPRQPESVLVCDYEMDHCETWTWPLEQAKRIANNPELVREIRQIADYSDVTTDDLDSAKVFEEVDTTYRGNRYIVGSERFEAQKNDVVRWVVRLRSSDKNTGPSVVTILAYEPDVGKLVVKRAFSDRTYVLMPGQNLDVEFSYKAVEDNQWIWTNVALAQGKEQEVQVEEISIKRYGPYAARVGRDHEAMGEVGIGQVVNLLEHPQIPPCSVRALNQQFQKANDCPKSANFLAAQPFVFKPGQRVRLTAEIEAQKEPMAFAVGLVDFQKGGVVASDRKTVLTGQTGKLETIFEIPASGSPAYMTALTAQGLGETSEFRVLNAKLEIAE